MSHPRRRPANLPGGVDHRSLRWEGRHRTAYARDGSGVFEIALQFRSDAFRVVYAVQLADEIWVLHAFQKKSTRGIKTPKRAMDLIKDRLRMLREILR